MQDLEPHALASLRSPNDERVGFEDFFATASLVFSVTASACLDQASEAIFATYEIAELLEDCPLMFDMAVLRVFCASAEEIRE